MIKIIKPEVITSYYNVKYIQIKEHPVIVILPNGLRPYKITTNNLYGQAVLYVNGTRLDHRNYMKDWANDRVFHSSRIIIVKSMTPKKYTTVYGISIMLNANT